MTSRSFAFAVSSVITAGVLITACKPPAALPPRPVTKVNTDSIERERAEALARARADSARNAELARQEAAADSLRRAREAAQRDAADNGDAMAVLRATIFFEYDQAVLTLAATELLAAKVPILQARPQLTLIVTGHTDDRGSAEYNIALGLRRASMVKDWLVANGIAASRIEIMSLGEEQPAVEGEGEFVWSQNRRGEFEPMAGGQ